MRPRAAAAAAGATGLVLLALTGCAGGHAAAKPAPLTGSALANEKVGAACSWLAGAEKRPAGSNDAPIGQAMLAHAGSLAIQAQEADRSWTRFSTDMSTIGQPDGQPALDRVTKVCATWAKNSKYYLTHPAQG